TPAALATSLTRVAWKPFLAKTRTAASRMRTRLSPVRAGRAAERRGARARRSLSEDSLIATGAIRPTRTGQRGGLPRRAQRARKARVLADADAGADARAGVRVGRGRG